MQEKAETIQADVKAELLSRVTYSDSEIRLECYADMTASIPNTGKGFDGTLAAIRFGGYPEQVRAMCEAISGGGTVELFDGKTSRKLKTLEKQYTRQISNGEIYSEAAMFLRDEAEQLPDGPAEEGEEGKQASLDMPPRKAYLYCPPGDRERLFAEIDKRTRVPLIPDFQEYLLEALEEQGSLKKLSVVSPLEPFDAWELSFSKNEGNLIGIVERGLKEGRIQIPGATAKSAKAFRGIQTVSQYLQAFGKETAERIKGQFEPLFDPEKEPLSEEVQYLNLFIESKAGYELYPAQLAVMEAAKRTLDKKEPVLVVAECGSGKSKIGAGAVYASQLSKGKPNTFNVVLCPSHMTQKWVRELSETIPNSAAMVVTSINCLKQFYRMYQREKKTYYAVISKEQARDGYMHRPAATYDRVQTKFVCPDCRTPIMQSITKDDVSYRIFADPEYFCRETAENHKCEACGTVLWEALEPSSQSEWVKAGDYGFVHRKFAYRALEHVKKENACRIVSELAAHPTARFGKGTEFPAAGAVRRFPLSSYIKKKMKGKIGALICDELQDYAQNSGQGDAMAEICRTADAFIGLTGTLINGYASGLFYLLYRLFPSYMQLDGKEYKSITDFCKEYGVYKETFTTEENYSANRRAVTRKTQEQMLPGVSPILYTRFFLSNAVFLSLQDMGKELPEYVEIPCPVPMDHAVETEYTHLENTFREWMRSVAKKNRWALSAFRNLLTVYPDQPYGQKPLIDRRENVIASPRDIGDIKDLWPKDKWVLKKAVEKVHAGERVLIYINWVRTDTQKKLKGLLEQEGCKTNILPVSVAPAKREGWIQKQLDSGMRVLVCNPILVQTGLDLNDFTTIIYFDIAYNLFVFRQSSRRSWRINQKAPRIEVYLPYYTGTIQHRALNLMASKLCAATLIEGFNFSDEGLAAMGQCHDMTSELARELTEGIKTSVEDVAKAFGRMAILHPASENTENSTAADTLKQQTKTVCLLSPLESAALLRARVGGTSRVAVSQKPRAMPEPQTVQVLPGADAAVNVQLCFADLIPA